MPKVGNCVPIKCNLNDVGRYQHFVYSNNDTKTLASEFFPLINGNLKSVSNAA